MRTIATKDGTQIYYKSWGTGKPVVFSHGWPLSADSWEAQMLFLASKGYRCITHGRRGHEVALPEASTAGGLLSFRPLNETLCQSFTEPLPGVYVSLAK